MDTTEDRIGPVRWLLIRLENVMTLLGLGAAIATVAAFANAWWWPFDLASHFRAQYFVGLVAIGLILCCVRRRTLGLVMIGLGLVNLATIVPLYRAPETTGAATGPPCRFMLMNVRTKNTRHDLVEAEIRRHDPDVLVLLEVDDRWLERLEGVLEGYPHTVAGTRHDNFGIAVASRHALEADVRYLGASRLPSVVARLTVEDVPLHLIATHPVPPAGPTGSRDRDLHLAAVADLVTELEGPVVVLGDLNATPWSAAFQSLVGRTGLRDASRGRGLHPTWPTTLPPMLIPIDHCLHSPEVTIEDERVGAYVGSDHFPLIVDGRLGIPAVASAPTDE